MRYLLLIYGPPFDPSSVPADIMEGQNAAYAADTLAIESGTAAGDGSAESSLLADDLSDRVTVIPAGAAAETRGRCHP